MDKYILNLKVKIYVYKHIKNCLIIPKQLTSQVSMEVDKGNFEISDEPVCIAHVYSGEKIITFDKLFLLLFLQKALYQIRKRRALPAL